MKVKIAFDLDKTISLSWQDDFPKTTKCVHCKGEARLAFVAHEFNTKPNSGEFVCDLYDNDPDGTGYWLHDACCVAVYLCKKCLKPTAFVNQA